MLTYGTIIISNSLYVPPNSLIARAINNNGEYRAKTNGMRFLKIFIVNYKIAQAIKQPTPIPTAH